MSRYVTYRVVHGEQAEIVWSTSMYKILLIPTVFTQQYYRLDVQLSKLRVSAFMAIMRLTKDAYQLR